MGPSASFEFPLIIETLNFGGVLFADPDLGVGEELVRGQRQILRSRALPNAAPVEYMEFLLNNREVQVPSFGGCANKCEGVFETLNMITRLLLHKFIAEANRKAA